MSDEQGVERQLTSRTIPRAIRSQIEYGGLPPGAKLLPERDLASSYGTCAKQGKTGRFQVLSIDRVQPPQEVADRLNVSAKAESVLRRENVFYADDDLLNRVTTYVPWTIAKGTGLLRDEVPRQFRIHGALEERQRVMTQIREEVSTRMPRAEFRALQLRPGVPVLDVWHTGIDQDGESYELTRFVMRGDMTGLLYDVPAE